MDLGLVSGTTIKPILRSPSGDPVAYEIRGAIIAIRDDITKNIIVSFD